MINWKKISYLLIKSVIYSLIIVIVEAILFFLIFWNINQIFYMLSFIILIEGGILLIVGGGVALYTPSVAKINEVMFHSKPWNAKRQKEIEKQMIILILTGIFLVIEALMLSSF